MPDGLRKQLSDAASVVTLPAAMTRNVSRAADAIIDIREQPPDPPETPPGSGPKVD
jgi:hypothetical protein